jgi:hypothetical protein
MYYVNPNARLMHLWICATKVNADVLPFLAKNKKSDSGLQYNKHNSHIYGGQYQDIQSVLGPWYGS